MTTAAEPTAQVRALVFDVFGTVVDWRSSVAAEVRALGWPVDPPAFADAWRAGYVPAMREVRDGLLPWTNIDGLHRRILGDLLAVHAVQRKRLAAAGHGAARRPAVGRDLLR